MEFASLSMDKYVGVGSYFGRIGIFIFIGRLVAL